MTQGNKGTEALRAEVSVERPERPRGQRMEARPRPPPAPPSRLRVPDLELPGHPPRSSERPAEPEARLPSRGHSLGCGSHYCFSDQQFSGPHRPSPSPGFWNEWARGQRSDYPPRRRCSRLGNSVLPPQAPRCRFRFRFCVPHQRRLNLRHRRPRTRAFCRIPAWGLLFAPAAGMSAAGEGNADPVSPLVVQRRVSAEPRCLFGPSIPHWMDREQECKVPSIGT